MTEQLTAAPEQQAAANVQQAAATGRKMQLPRFNCRITSNFSDRQVENIEILKRRTGGTDVSVLRAGVDLLAYVSALPTESDPEIYLTHFFANLAQGDTHGR